MRTVGRLKRTFPYFEVEPPRKRPRLRKYCNQAGLESTRRKGCESVGTCQDSECRKRKFEADVDREQNSDQNPQERLFCVRSDTDSVVNLGYCSPNKRHRSFETGDVCRLKYHQQFIAPEDTRHLTHNNKFKMVLNTGSKAESEQFTSFLYWRPALPILDAGEMDLLNGDDKKMDCSSISSTDMDSESEAAVDPDYTSFNFWKMPIPDIDFSMMGTMSM